MALDACKYGFRLDRRLVSERRKRVLRLGTRSGPRRARRSERIEAEPAGIAEHIAAGRRAEKEYWQ